MRRHQLSFKIENFSEDRNYHVHGYIDANKPEELLKEFLTECHKAYRPELSFEEFCKGIEEYSEDRFGRTEVQVDKAD